MIKIGDSLRKLIGRIKEYMDAVFMTIGGVLVPLGFTLLFYSIQSNRLDLENYGIFSAILGLVCWILSFWFAREKNNETKIIQIRLEKVLNSIDKQIKGLREDVDKRGKEK